MWHKHLILLLAWASSPLAVLAADLWVEAERFDSKGGWVLDQQFMDQMGSPYLLAHGMGVPVADATTQVEVPADGCYEVYVRTYNWTAPWSDRPGPGQFTVTVGNKKLKTVLGTVGSRWLWQRAGAVQLQKGTTMLRLHDLTGFEGRVDALYLTTDQHTAIAEMTDDELVAFRRQQLGLTATPARQYAFDFVVIGGGVAGMCAAASASRQGLRVALVGDRPVWGGNNSSEVRVHLGGVIEMGPYKGLGRIQREFGHRRKGNAQPASYYEDEKKDSFLMAEKNVTLFAKSHATRVTMQDSRITGVVIANIETGEETLLSAPLFADCTGDGSIGYWAGADYAMGREGRDEYQESLAPEVADSLVMGASVQWYSETTDGKTGFPAFSYGIDFNEDNCEPVTMGEWTWETGMNRNQITEAERIRDYGFLVIYSNWSFLKNRKRDNDRFRRRRLAWVAYVAGKRESRRLLGDYVLKQDDIDKNVYHEDASFTTTWSIDLHFPDSINSVHFPGSEFKTATVHRFIHPYAVPYRCLYSRNVDNLLMAGRNISTTHVALGTTRVMRTTGMMGEVVGMAAALCHRHGVLPRGVYQDYLPELKVLMQEGAGKQEVPDNQHFNEPNQLLPVPRALAKEESR